METNVYYKDDPGRKGQLTGKERDRSDGKILQVHWEDGSFSWEPEYELENESSEPDDVFTLLKKKQFGRLIDLRKNLTYIQLSGKLANLVYSMDTTNTDFYPYQYKPVLTFLESPSNGLLIADEVGLGKTIEAGLIWTELRARFDARRLLVICPAMLRDKWCDELSKRFGVAAVQLSAVELLKELKTDKLSVPDGKGIVCSLQGISPPRGWRDAEKKKSADAELARYLESLSGQENVIDLLIVDEAHYLRNPQTTYAAAGQLLREVSEHVIFLSATPVNNKAGDLFQLLRLIDPDTFSDEHIFPHVLAANEPLIKARDLSLNTKKSGDDIKNELKNASTFPLLMNNRQLKGLLDRDITDSYLSEAANRIELANRIERINLLRHVVNRTRKVEVHEFKVVREPYSQFVELDPDGPEQDFYTRVTEAIRIYAWERDISDGFLLSPPQRQVSSCMYAAAISWKEKFSKVDLEQLLYEDTGPEKLKINKDNYSPLISHLSTTVLPYIDIEALYKTDSKYSSFIDVVHSHLKEHPGEKIIVFSYFKATLHYLSDRLKEDEITTQLLYGGIGETKQDIIDRFHNSDTLQILLTSEVASEGVDLQFSRVLINYDLPWNPMRIEQRIGRIDRIGQQAEKIIIWNLGYANTVDERIFSRLLDKLNIFKQALGGMEAILGEMISKLTSDLLSKPLSTEQENERIDKAYIATENIRQQQEQLEKEAAHLIAHGGYILEKVKSAHDFKKRITDDDIKIYVYEYLTRYTSGFEFLEDPKDPLSFSIRLSPEMAGNLDDFIRKNKLHGITSLARGHNTKCLFSNKVRAVWQRDELINQFHPLVRYISYDLEQRNEAFYPLVALSIDNENVPEFQPGVYAFAAKKWTFNGMRTEEEMQARAIRIDVDDELFDLDISWSLVNQTRLLGRDWLAAANSIDINMVEKAFDTCEIKLNEDYKITRDDKINENEDRVSLQIATIEKHLDRLVNTQLDVLEGYKMKGNIKMYKLPEGLIRMYQNKFGIKIAKLNKQLEMKSFPTDIVHGVIQVV